MLDFTTETRTFVGEPDTWPGYGYAGYIVGGTYQLNVLRLGDGSVELTSTNPQTRRTLISAQLFERWWRLVPRLGISQELGG